jgi:hypothetical protein
MRQQIKALVDKLCDDCDAVVKKAEADTQVAASREAGLKKREDNLNGILKQHATDLAAANARAKDAEDHHAKEKAAHKETREKLNAAYKEIGILQRLAKVKPPAKEKTQKVEAPK